MKKELVPLYSMSAMRNSAADECSTCRAPAAVETRGTRIHSPDPRDLQELLCWS